MNALLHMDIRFVCHKNIVACESKKLETVYYNNIDDYKLPGLYTRISFVFVYSSSEE